MKTQSKNGSKAKAETIEKKNYLMVPPSSIITLLEDDKKNPREDYGDIEELMNSILENGIKNPLKGYEKDGKYVLKDGHRRMAAINLALQKGKKIERVPFMIEERPLNEEERTLEYLIYNEGKPLTMLEQSEVINRLLNFQWKVTEIVKKTGKARGYIENLILLTRIPMVIRNYIKEGKISAHAVIQIMQAVKADDAKVIEEVEAAIKAAKEAGKTKATPKHVKNDKVKGASFGKFYQWAVTIADGIAGGDGVIAERAEVLEKLLSAFENGKPAGQFAEEFFIDKKFFKADAKTKKK